MELVMRVRVTADDGDIARGAELDNVKVEQFEDRLKDEAIKAWGLAKSALLSYSFIEWEAE